MEPQKDIKPAPVERVGPVEPVEPAGRVSSGEGLAEVYVSNELQQARTALRNTAIFGALLTLAVLCYMGYLTARLRSELNPSRAAETASGLIIERVETGAEDLSIQIQERVPQLIAELPDYAKEQMPIYRQSLESQIEDDLRTHCTEASQELDQTIDGFLEEHKAEIGLLLQNANNRQTVKQLGAELQREFFLTLKKTETGDGESLQSKLNQSLVALRQVNMKMARLAANKNLTPEEKKARRAIAILASMAEHHVKATGLRDIVSNTSLGTAETTPGA